jgi:hypothetical protein
MGKYLSLDGDITFLEIIPIALSIFLWHKLYNSVLKGSKIPKASSLASVLQAELAL